MEDASDLTLGGVVCGNPSKALKSRQRHLLADHDNEKLSKLFEQVQTDLYLGPLIRDSNITLSN